MYMQQSFFVCTCKMAGYLPHCSSSMFMDLYFDSTRGLLLNMQEKEIAMHVASSNLGR